VEKSKYKLTFKGIIPIFTILVSVIFIYFGFTKYGFWDPMKGPKPGFVPVLISFLLLGISLLALFTSLKEEAPEFPKDNWYCVLGMVALVIGSFIIGLIPSVIVYLLVWLKRFEKVSWKSTIIVMAIVLVIVIGVFVMWLGIDFPKGIILDAIFR